MKMLNGRKIVKHKKYLFMQLIKIFFIKNENVVDFNEIFRLLLLFDGGNKDLMKFFWIISIFQASTT